MVYAGTRMKPSPPSQDPRQRSAGESSAGPAARGRLQWKWPPTTLDVSKRGCKNSLIVAKEGCKKDLRGQTSLQNSVAFWPFNPNI